MSRLKGRSKGPKKRKPVDTPRGKGGLRLEKSLSSKNSDEAEPLACNNSKLPGEEDKQQQLKGKDPRRGSAVGEGMRELLWKGHELCWASREKRTFLSHVAVREREKGKKSLAELRSSKQKTLRRDTGLLIPLELDAIQEGRVHDISRAWHFRPFLKKSKGRGI